VIRDVILALDLATRTGWAALDLDGKRLDSGAWTLAPRARRPKADRWVRFAEALGDLLAAYVDRVAVLALERPFTGGPGPRTPQVAWGLVALAELAAERRGIAVAHYPPATVKLVVAGNGHASKVQVGKAVSRRLGYSVPGGDEADALAVALTAWERLDLAELACGHAVEISPAKKRRAA
jgi:Holliday junction resolvasome RuvABC endonuclease subunit